MTEVFTWPVVVAGTAALAGLAFLIRRNKKGNTQTEDHPQVASSESGIPTGLESDYSHGVDPCGSGKPVMYTLHTCRHCVHLKDFLDNNGIEHHLVYVDDFQDPARRTIMTTMRSFNPRGSFPTFVLPDGRSAVGFRERQIRELLGLEA